MLISQDNKGFSQILERHFRFCVVFLGILLFALSLYDLLSPPISKTIWRQTQTAMLTENFVNEGFSFKGLYLNIMGREKALAVYEFPVYNFVVGVLYVFFGIEQIWGKVVSLTCSLFCMMLLIELVRRRYGSCLGLLGGLFFILSPIPGTRYPTPVLFGFTRVAFSKPL